MTPDLFPYGVYDIKQCGMVFIGLFKNEADCWQTFGGWPSQEEIDWHKKQGLTVLPLTLTYDPPRLNAVAGQTVTMRKE